MPRPPVRAAVGLALLLVASGSAAPSGAAGRGVTQRVSVPDGGGQGNGASYTATLSGDGGSVAFVTAATNLTGADRNGPVKDVLVRDLAGGSLQRVSVSSAGVQANGASDAASLDFLGDKVAFTSYADNLAGKDRNGPPDSFSQDVFVHDRRTQTTRVNASSAGVAGNDYSFEPALSGNGRFVAFSSAATDLVPGDTNRSLDVFVRDLRTSTLERVSVGTSGQGTGRSWQPSISGNGRYVAFQSDAPLVPGDTNGVADVFVRDRVTGTTRRVSVSAQGQQADGGTGSPALSRDGRVIAFTGQTTDLGPGDESGDPTRPDLFVKDLRTGTVLVVQGAAFLPTLDGTGSTLLFDRSYGSGRTDVVVQDLRTGERDVVSKLAAGGPAILSNASDKPLSGDGRVLVWDSRADGVVTDDTDDDDDVFVTRVR